MKVYRIRVEYGKNQKYMACDWVVENAVEQYKTMWTEDIRNKGWHKEINFRTYDYPTCETKEDGTCYILAYTTRGYEYFTPVK